MAIIVRMLGPDEAAMLDTADADVFDFAIDRRWATEFLADSRQHLAVALDAGRVICMVSGMHYVHPDKPPELWVNEVGEARPHRGQGVGRRLLAALFERGRTVGCAEVWVGTERSNAAARRLYAAAGGEDAPEDFVIVSFRLVPDV